MDYLQRFKELAKLDYKADDNVRKEILAITNYDESKVPEYTLPSALDLGDGRRVTTAMEWYNLRRPQIFNLFRDQMYGQVLPRPDRMEFELLSRRDDALDGTAIRKEIRVHLLMHNGRRHFFDILFYAPKSAAEKPVPCFLGLNFKGNQATTDESDVRMTGLLGEPALLTEENRGCQVHRWQFRQLIQHGYAGATVCYHDIFPDRSSGWSKSALALFEDLEGFDGAHERYTSIGVWAWGLSRAMDYLETEPLVDARRVAMHGHSRLGKTALWAGACDERFRIVMSNCSGCGGASLNRRKFGETYLFITNAAPHWFVKGFRQYMAQEENMPFDQHELIALSAPRPVSVHSATLDTWADPKGEFLAAKGAEEVYALFGSKGLPADEWPAPDTRHNGDISYFLRTGKHDQTLEDWMEYIDLADRYLK